MGEAGHRRVVVLLWCVRRRRSKNNGMWEKRRGEGCGDVRERATGATVGVTTSRQTRRVECSGWMIWS